MKRYASAEDFTLCYAVMVCPFCRYRNTENPNMPWCSNPACLVEYYRARLPDPKSGARRFVFDTKRKTERFAWAKAIMGAGGVRIGGK